VISSGRFFRWVSRFVIGVLVAIVLLPVAVWFICVPATPDAFYAWRSVLPAKPGELLRAEPFVLGLPQGARAWRILYTTTRENGAAAVASAIVVAPSAATHAPHPIVAWMHGTTGIAEGCAPSLLEQPFDGVPALAWAIRRGWVVVATDYAGLGTAGPHHYLVGADEAHSALDSIRAVRQLDDVGTTNNVVVWGHSQGGHAALWVGVLSASYAPEVHIAGIAALAPASDLPVLVYRSQETTIGKILTSYIVMAYSATYADIVPSKTLRFGASLLVNDMSRRCLAGASAFPLAAEAALLHRSIFKNDSSTGALGKRLTENIPSGRIDTPILIAQGLSDDLVLPSVQLAFVRRACDNDPSVSYYTYAGRDHLSLLATDSPLIVDLMNWSQDKLLGVASVNGCFSKSN
jgi:alpha-beta hydrolase superfamily lysophospholipase